MSKTISVIVPVYNAQLTLDRCVKSILDQDYNNIQLILVDDGSNDNSPEICDKYTALDNRVYVLHRSNGGVCAARNSGLDVAIGQYISFVDCDDYILQGMYSRMIKEIEEKNLDVCICNYFSGQHEGYSTKSFGGKAISPGIYDSFDIEEILVAPNDWYQEGVACAVWNKVYRASLFDTLRFSGRWGEDYEVNDTINSQHRSIGVIDSAYLVWCNNEDSQTHDAYSAKKNSFLSIIEDRVVKFSGNSFITNKSKVLFCNLFIEYSIIAQLRSINPPKEHQATFIKYCKDLKGHIPVKQSIRYLLFRLSPWIYYQVTKSVYDKYPR